MKHRQQLFNSSLLEVVSRESTKKVQFFEGCHWLIKFITFSKLYAFCKYNLKYPTVIGLEGLEEICTFLYFHG